MDLKVLLSFWEWVLSEVVLILFVELFFIISIIIVVLSFVDVDLKEVLKLDLGIEVDFYVVDNFYGFSFG